MGEADWEGKLMKRYEVLSFIDSYMRANGWAPSYREIGAAVGIRSTSTIMMHVLNLDRDGLIVFGRGPRKIRMTENGSALLAELEGENDVRTNKEQGQG